MKTKDIARRYEIDQALFEQYLVETNANYKHGIGCIIIEDDEIPEHIKKFNLYFHDYYEKRKLDAIKKEQQKVQQLEQEEKKRQAKQEQEEKKRQAEQEKQFALANMLITSGFSFDGYRIIKYSGYISGDDAISINRGTDGIFSSATNVSKSLTDSLVKIRRRAIQELKEAAYDLGCNAVIGVDFDYITLDPETANTHGGTTYLPYVFCVTANGNAVIIEKEE